MSRSQAFQRAEAKVFSLIDAGSAYESLRLIETISHRYFVARQIRQGQSLCLQSIDKLFAQKEFRIGFEVCNHWFKFVEQEQIVVHPDTVSQLVKLFSSIPSTSLTDAGSTIVPTTTAAKPHDITPTLPQVKFLKRVIQHNRKTIAKIVSLSIDEFHTYYSTCVTTLAVTSATDDEYSSLLPSVPSNTIDNHDVIADIQAELLTTLFKVESSAQLWLATHLFKLGDYISANNHFLLAQMPAQHALLFSNILKQLPLQQQGQAAFRITLTYLALGFVARAEKFLLTLKLKLGVSALENRAKAAAASVTPESTTDDSSSDIITATNGLSQLTPDEQQLVLYFHASDAFVMVCRSSGYALHPPGISPALIAAQPPRRADSQLNDLVLLLQRTSVTKNSSKLPLFKHIKRTYRLLIENSSDEKLKQLVSRIGQLYCGVAAQRSFLQDMFGFN